MRRRDFVKLAGLLPFTFTLPGLAAASVRQPRWDRVLLLLELNGGNDGLNTVVPYADLNYYRLRPQLSVVRDSVIQLSDQLAFNPAMEALMPAWKARELGVILGVGYPEPNRSHFRSIAIWETGSSSDEFLQEGWISRLFAKARPPHTFAAEGIAIGRGLGPLQGRNMRNIVMRNAQHFMRQARGVKEPETVTGNTALSHLLAVQADLYRAATTLKARYHHKPRLQTTFPKSRLGRELETTAGLLASRIPVSVVKVSHGSFDTHSRQRGQHDRLLQELATALSAFRSAMQEINLWDRVLVLTYSEFGRRASENGSRGTDHGTAAAHFILGGHVKGGFYGQQPSLTRLLDGDLRYHVDYRSLYGTVARHWWGISDDVFAKRFPPIDCLTPSP
ncbi:MAG: DUF1501 domain-containing protein [Acidiferrobacterales bacterium]